MVDDRRASLLAHASALERRDASLAGEIAELDQLLERVGTLRARRSTISGALASLPDECAAASAGEREAERARADALAALAEAEARLAALERGRRPRQDDLDQARRELTRATEEAHDAGVRLGRLAARRLELDDLARTLVAEAEGLAVEARSVAGAIDGIGRVADAGKTPPGPSLEDVEQWGARTRAALFVARSGLATERERVVVEANTLGSAVLGEPLGASSAALVRRRIEEALGGSA